MNKCVYENCFEISEFMCSCSGSAKYYCGECIERHKKKYNRPHNIKILSKNLTDDNIFTNAMLQIKFTEKEIQKITQQRLIEINDESKKVLKEL